MVTKRSPPHVSLQLPQASLQYFLTCLWDYLPSNRTDVAPRDSTQASWRMEVTDILIGSWNSHHILLQVNHLLCLIFCNGIRSFAGPAPLYQHTPWVGISSTRSLSRRNDPDPPRMSCSQQTQHNTHCPPTTLPTAPTTFTWYGPSTLGLTERVAAYIAFTSNNTRVDEDACHCDHSALFAPETTSTSTTPKHTWLHIAQCIQLMPIVSAS